jgi:hypothetical protein
MQVPVYVLIEPQPVISRFRVEWSSVNVGTLSAIEQEIAGSPLGNSEENIAAVLRAGISQSGWQWQRLPTGLRHSESEGRIVTAIQDGKLTGAASILSDINLQWRARRDHHDRGSVEVGYGTDRAADLRRQRALVFQPGAAAIK